MADYIHDVRQLVGHAPIILTFAGGILVNDAGEILLQKRADYQQWGMVGGALEFGETTSAACQREFREETGLEVEPLRILDVDSGQIQHYPNGDVAQAVLVTYLVRAVGGQLNADNDETLALEYFSEEQLPPIFNAQHERIIANYFAARRSGSVLTNFD
jgi:ADP-ribose pyrophosphatase YjhB (NUDIX family)